LGVESVDRNQSFFDLGGNSLLALKLIARVRKACGVDLPMTTLFAARTFAAIATALERAPRQDGYTIVRANRSGPLPLSFSQERVWFIGQLAPGTDVYNSVFNLRFRGPLRSDALTVALTDIVQRHEILRTTFHSVEGMPVQQVHEPFRVAVAHVDLCHASADERDAEVRRITSQQLAAPFDTDRLPLFRSTLVKLGPQDHVLIFAEHHFIHDGWSVGVLLADLRAAYAARACGDPPVLPELPIQFVDYVAWQRADLTGAKLEALLDWWRTELAGAPPLLELPSDRARPKAQSFRGEELVAPLPELLFRTVEAMARAEGVTLYVAALSIFAALLHRLSGAEDLVIGSTVAGRSRIELESVIGMIVNTIPLRLDVAGNPTFRELLHRVATTCARAYAHQDLPFGHLVEAANPQRDPAYSPVIQVDFSFHDSPMPELDFVGARAELEHPPHESAKFDLSITVVPRPKPTFLWEYSFDLFERSTVERMIRQYETLLAVFAADPGLRLADAPLASSDDRSQATTRSVAARSSAGTDTGLFSAHRTQPGPPGAWKACDASQIGGRANEAAMAAIWSEVLGVEIPGPDADFFELGGHSLLATRLIWKVNRTFDVKLALRTLFDLPRIEEFSQEVTRLMRATSGGRSPAGRDVKKRTPAVTK
jgi:acyl carrier protein